MSMAIGGIGAGAPAQAAKQASSSLEQLLQKQNQQTRTVQQFETQQQTIKDQLLQLESSSDSAAGAEDTKEALEKQLEKITEQLEEAQAELEKITSQLTTAQAGASAEVTETTPSAAVAPARRQRDVYESGDPPPPSAGLYELQPDEETGYQIVFQPADDEEANV